MSTEAFNNEEKWSRIQPPIAKMIEDLKATTTPEELADAIALLPQVRAQRKVTQTREQMRAEAARQAGLPIKAQIGIKKESEAEKKAMDDRLLAARMALTKKEDEEKVERIKADQTANKLKQEEREKRRKAEQIVWEAKAEERKATLEAQREEADKAAKRKEAARRAQMNDAINRVEWTMTSADPTYDIIKSAARRMTTEEKLEMIEQLNELSARAQQARQFFTEVTK
jgi:hypothetical protein